MLVHITVECETAVELQSLLTTLGLLGRDLHTRIFTEAEELHLEGAMMIEEYR